MVTHGFRNQTIAPAKNHNCNANPRNGTAREAEDWETSIGVGVISLSVAALVYQ
jgi:hypothetical protein